MNSELYKKRDFLEDRIRSLKKAAVAFSSGVDSTFLLKTAHDVLGKNAVALTARSAAFSEREFIEAKQFCEKEGIEHILVDIDVFGVPGFSDNPPDRCYICKKAIFSQFVKTAANLGIENVLEGSNADDTGDYRPGMRAVRELGVLSPLLEAGLKKEEIRLLSKEKGLDTWNKPSFACLATRFLYGENITSKKLAMVEKAENKLYELGFSQFRVRVHGDIARIEIPVPEFTKMIGSDILNEVNSYFKELGFLYVAMDLGGFVSGNMNKTIINTVL